MSYLRWKRKKKIHIIHEYISFMYIIYLICIFIMMFFPSIIEKEKAGAYRGVDPSLTS